MQNQPAPTTTNPQGVGSVAPTAMPSAPTLPQAPQVAATPPPVQAPNLNTSQTLQDIGNYYQIPRQTQAITGAGQAEGAVAQANFEHQKAENEIKIQNQQNALDPSKYIFTKNKDGSVTITNSVGDTVPIGTYAALTGANPAQALQQAGANDEASQKFIQAYNNLQTYIQARIGAANGDTQAAAQLADFYKSNPGLQNIQLGQLQKAFMGQYGSYFGEPQGNNQLSLANQGVNSTLTSANNPLTTSPYENINYFGAQENANPYAQALGFGNASGTYGSGSNATAQLLAGLNSQQSTGQ